MTSRLVEAEEQEAAAELLLPAPLHTMETSVIPNEA